MNPSYHIGFTESPNAKYAILTGDPGRVECIARYLDDPHFFAENREYRTWRGKTDGENVLVTSTGIGGPSAAISVEELYAAGVRSFIRVGTCGGMQTEVAGGDIVIATAAVRMEGTSREYAPIEYPAVANYDIIQALALAAKTEKIRRHIGVVQSKDSFYGQHSPSRMPVGTELENRWDAWIKCGCIASEMECAAIFIVSSILRARCGGVLSVVWNQERTKAGLPNPEVHDMDGAIRTAVQAIGILIASDKPITK